MFNSCSPIYSLVILTSISSICWILFNYGKSGKYCVHFCSRKMADSIYSVDAGYNRKRTEDQQVVLLLLFKHLLPFCICSHLLHWNFSSNSNYSSSKFKLKDKFLCAFSATSDPVNLPYLKPSFFAFGDPFLHLEIHLLFSQFLDFTFLVSFLS